MGISNDCPKLTEKEWNEIYMFCFHQSLLGIGFCGIEQDSRHGVPRDLLLRWYAVSQQIENRNRLLNERCVELQHLFAKGGFRNCVLKGQGNAQMYPRPLRRQSGDVDVWVEGNVEKIVGFMTGFCNQEESMTIGYHHADFPIWKDVEVEVHWKPTWLNSPYRNYVLQKWFIQQSQNQLRDEAGMINVPDVNFNVVYQLVHIFNHFLQEGVGLRQLMDYYYVLMNSNDRPMMPIIHKIGMSKFAGAVMYVLTIVFSIPSDKMICDLREKEGRFLLEEILRSGNFGQYDVRNKTLMNQKGMMRKLYQVKRGMRYLRYYPEEVLCSPFRIYHVIWRKLKLWRYLRSGVF